MSDARDPILEAVGLGKRHGDGEGAVQALDAVDLAVLPRELVAIMGPSGCGKSTLLSLLGGLDVPSAGTVRIDGVSLADLDDDARTLLRRRRLGFVFQFFNLLPTFSARENVALPLLLDGVAEAEAHRRAQAELERVGLAARAEHLPSQLSGGEQQRTAIARALVFQPALLLADEPTGNLDSRSSQQILELLRGVVDEQGTTVVLVTHDEQTGARADRLVRMLDGRITSDRRAGEGER